MIHLLLLALCLAPSYGQNIETCNENGAVRLVDGSGPMEGRVEICVRHTWGTVCDDSWDDREAAVVCQQLGFARNGAIAISRAYFGEGNGSIHLDNVDCAGSESALSQCPSLGQLPNCNHGEDASVVCLAENFTCTDGHVRLADSDLANQGRVEICFNNRYGTVCDDHWSSTDAGVVCRQLGFTSEGALATTSGELFGPGFGVIYLDQVACEGEESGLAECPHSGVAVSDCTHLKDAGVVCRTDTPVMCNDSDIRLVNGRSPNEGRVEVCSNDVWGTVCDDNWGSNDAAVVCRQLGYSETGAIAVLGGLYGIGDGLILLDGVDCSGSEGLLMDCRHDGLNRHNCEHLEDAGVFCQDPLSQCSEGEIRLANGLEGRPYEGRLEVCINNHWGTVCDDRYNVEEATVVCRQLGFTAGHALPLPSAYFGQSVGKIWLDEVRCTGEESDLLDCQHNGFGVSDCRHNEDVSIICPLPPGIPKDCENGEVRLVGGETSNEGRVELCFNGHWGTVCDDHWDSRDASVVCRQLGYSESTVNNSVPALGGVFGAGSGPILLDDVDCQGSESTVFACDAKDLAFTDCSHQEDAGVVCPVEASTSVLCADGDLRLVGGSSAAGGKVEVCYHGRWGAVCSTDFDELEAQVVCRQLGFDMRRTRSAPILNGAFGFMSSPILVRGLDCVGTESSFLECPETSFTLRSSCGHPNIDVAAVLCTELACSDGEFRLVGSDGNLSGRVEVCKGEVWGEVCEEGFTDQLAAHVCSSFGHQPTGFTRVNGEFYGSPSRLSYSIAAETGLVTQVLSCGEPGAAGLSCLKRGETKVCETGEVRLGGGGVSEGRVEVCLNNQWGTVCDDSWDDRAAAVVCRQLELPFEQAISQSFGGSTSLPILLDDIKCHGEERVLFECNRTSFWSHNCDHSEDVGVVCELPPTTPVVPMSSVSIPLIVVSCVLLILAFLTVAGMLVYTRLKKPHPPPSQQTDLSLPSLDIDCYEEIKKPYESPEHNVV